jgi:hypothetical protein
MNSTAHTATHPDSHRLLRPAMTTELAKIKIATCPWPSLFFVRSHLSTALILQAGLIPCLTRDVGATRSVSPVLMR